MELIDGEIVATIPKLIEWWEAENTGWSDGISWFATGGTRTNPSRFKSAEEAIQHINDIRKNWQDDYVKWRYVHVTLEREGNKSVKTKEWTEI